jgi:hypothetical protein
MEQPQLTGDLAERIINLLRDNPGVSLTLTDISDMLAIPVEELAAHLEELSGANGPLLHDLTPDGVDVYSFPAEYQRGTT